MKSLSYLGDSEPNAESRSFWKARAVAWPWDEERVALSKQVAVLESGEELIGTVNAREVAEHSQLAGRLRVVARRFEGTLDGDLVVSLEAYQSADSKGVDWLRLKIRDWSSGTPFL